MYRPLDGRWEDLILPCCCWDFLSIVADDRGGCRTETASATKKPVFLGETPRSGRPTRRLMNSKSDPRLPCIRDRITAFRLVVVVRVPAVTQSRVVHQFLVNLLHNGQAKEIRYQIVPYEKPPKRYTALIRCGLGSLDVIMYIVEPGRQEKMILYNSCRFRLGGRDSEGRSKRSRISLAPSIICFVKS